ncbi:hypothetical protein KIPB_014806, partial [Kipferlia bialata]
AEYTTFRPLSIFAGTYNVNETKPAKEGEREKKSKKSKKGKKSKGGKGTPAVGESLSPSPSPYQTEETPEQESAALLTPSTIGAEGEDAPLVESLERWLCDPCVGKGEGVAEGEGEGEDFLPDVYVLGFQELDMSATGLIRGEGETNKALPWRESVQKAVNTLAPYTLLAERQLVGMYICVFVRTARVHLEGEREAETADTLSVSDVHVSSVACGLLG